jgi:hypothetical protein
MPATLQIFAMSLIDTLVLKHPPLVALAYHSRIPPPYTRLNPRRREDLNCRAFEPAKETPTVARTTLKPITDLPISA